MSDSDWSVFDLSVFHLVDAVVGALSFECYLDDSYGEGATVIALAGYFATSENWKRYELLARKIYEKNNVRVLHTKKLVGTKEDFAGWAKQKKAAFIKELFDAAETCEITGVSHCITKSLGKSFRNANKKTSNFSPLAMLFDWLVNAVCESQGLLDLGSGRDTAFIVEAGNKNNAGILRKFEDRQKADQNKRAKSLSFINKNDCLAIQLADFWAFHSRKLATRLLQCEFRTEDCQTEIRDQLSSIAFVRCPHSLHVTFGGVSSPIGEPNILMAGTTRSVHFGPMTH